MISVVRGLSDLRGMLGGITAWPEEEEISVHDPGAQSKNLQKLHQCRDRVGEGTLEVN